LGRLEVGWEKVACWSTKAAAITLKRVTIEESFCGQPIGSHQHSFQRYHSRPPRPLLFLRIGGSQPPPKTPIAIISGTGKATGFKFGQYIHTVHPNKKPLKILEKRGRGRIQGLPKFFGYPILAQTRVKLQTSNCVRTFIGSIETKAH